MIKSKHHIFIYQIFTILIRILLPRNFKSVNIEGQLNDNGNAVLVIANHISWWDGFWIMYLNLKIIKRKFHFMIQEKQLQKHWYFKYIGGYSIKKKTRSIIESLNYTNELLNHHRNMVFMFPQGQIHSMHNQIMTFQKGIERIIAHTAPQTQVLFVVNLIDYFSDSKPNLYMYLKSYSAKDLQQCNIETTYNTFYTQVLNTQKSKVS